MIFNIRSKRIYRYITEFGLISGSIIFYKLRRSKSPMVSIHIPGLKYPTLIRKTESDFFVFEEIFIDKAYSIDFRKLKSNLIIDAGANTGLAALYFLWKKPDVNIICIEPHHLNFEVLHKNLKNYNNVTLYRKALWKNDTFLKFSNINSDSWGFEVIETNQSESQLEAISLNEIIRENNIDEIALIKFDIEGSEKEVFESNNNWAEITKTIIVEVHENLRAGAERSVLDLAMKCGFTLSKKVSIYTLTK